MIDLMNFGLPGNFGLPENFSNCTVLESLLQYVSSIPLYSEIIVQHSSTWKPAWLLSGLYIKNHDKKLKDSKQDSLLLVYKYINSTVPSCTILSVLAKVEVVQRYPRPVAVSRMSSRQGIESILSAN